MLTICFSLINFVFQISSCVFVKGLLFLRLTFFILSPLFGLDYLAIATDPASYDPIILGIVPQAMDFSVSAHSNLDSLRLKFLYSLEYFPKPCRCRHFKSIAKLQIDSVGAFISMEIKILNLKEGFVNMNITVSSAIHVFPNSFVNYKLTLVTRVSVMSVHEPAQITVVIYHRLWIII